jgi:hypothetical protein
MSKPATLLCVQKPVHGSTICFGPSVVDPSTDPHHIEFLGVSIEVWVRHVRLMEKEL